MNIGQTASSVNFKIKVTQKRQEYTTKIGHEYHLPSTPPPPPVMYLAFHDTKVETLTKTTVLYHLACRSCCGHVGCFVIHTSIFLSSRNNQHHAQICTTALFYILAPTCFGSSLPSSGSFWIRLSYMKIQIDLVVYHTMLVKWPVCRGMSDTSDNARYEH
jgi:hypothetical protein